MQTAAKRRPFLVWFIVIATGVGFLFFVLFVYVVARQWASIPEEGKKAFQTLSTLTWIAAAIGTVTTVLGTV